MDVTPRIPRAIQAEHSALPSPRSPLAAQPPALRDRPLPSHPPAPVGRLPPASSPLHPLVSPWSRAVETQAPPADRRRPPGADRRGSSRATRERHSDLLRSLDPVLRIQLCSASPGCPVACSFRLLARQTA